MPFTEDFSVFLSDDDFAYEATYTPASTGIPVMVNVIFDGAFKDPLSHENIEPQVHGQESDFSTVADDDDIVINSISYKIRTPEPDGTGWITLVLEVV